MRNLTATDARNLMPRNRISAWVAETDKAIAKAAAEDRTSTRVAYEIVSEWPADNSGAPRMDVSPGKEFAEHFRAAGFEVREFYEARQFVDTGIVISWEQG